MKPSYFLKDVCQQFDSLYVKLDDIYTKHPLSRLKYVLEDISNIELLLTDLIEEFENLKL